MRCPSLLPDPSQLRLEYVSDTDERITLVLHTTQPQASCPECGAVNTRVHSRYRRTLADLPWNGTPVRLRLHCRRFFCDRQECSRRIFTERLPGVTRRYGRRTARLSTALYRLAYALGGEAGARLAMALGLLSSPDILLRLLRAAPPSGATHLRYIGIDDWSFRRGRRFGTLLVDLEQGKPVDLLADRQPETVAAWLKQHPGIEVITRDGSAAYAQAAREGAPQARQVADRWHLLKNLVDWLVELLSRHRGSLEEITRELAAAQRPNDEPAGAEVDREDTSPEDASGEAGASENPASNRLDERWQAEAVLQKRREQQQARYEEARRLYRAGHPIAEVARQADRHPSTVHRYLQRHHPPRQKRKGGRPNTVEPWRPYLEERWRAGVRHGMQLYRELLDQGFTGSHDAVQRFIAPWRGTQKKSRRPSRSPGGEPREAQPKARAPTWERVPSARRVTWWLLGKPEKRQAGQEEFLERLTSRCPAVATGGELVLEFFRLVRERDQGALEPWLSRVQESSLGEFQNFAAGLRHDWEAVTAALSLAWSNGPVEGQVNRLKLIKRQMYGRANFDLLRARVLPPV
jgi:transposase